MPIYEYECTQCGHQTEAWQSFSDAPLGECSHCHGKMKKLISQSSFHLKGSGWYVTDYANKSGGNQTEPASSENSTTNTAAKESGEKPEKKVSAPNNTKETSKKNDA